MMLPLQNITHVITPGMHPVFSDYQNDLNRLAVSYEKIIRLLAFIGLPLSVFLWFTAREITLIIFGDQWIPSISVFQILAISVGIQIIMSSSGSIFQASNDTRSLFICGVFSAALNVTGILTGIFFFKSLEAVAWCIAMTFCINFLQCYWQMYRITFHRAFTQLVRQLLHPLLLSGILFFILYTLNPLINTSLLISLILKGAIYVGTGLLYIQLTGEYNIVKQIKTRL